MVDSVLRVGCTRRRGLLIILGGSDLRGIFLDRPTGWNAMYARGPGSDIPFLDEGASIRHTGASHKIRGIWVIRIVCWIGIASQAFDISELLTVKEHITIAASNKSFRLQIWGCGNGGRLKHTTITAFRERGGRQEITRIYQLPNKNFTKKQTPDHVESLF